MSRLTPEQISSYKPGCSFTERNSTVISSDFSIDGKFFVTSNQNNQILWMDCLRGKEKEQIPSKKYGVGLVKYTHGKTAVLHSSTKVNHDLRLLDVEQQSYYRYYVGHTRNVTALTTSNSEDIFASAGEDKTVRIWDFRENNCVGKVYVNSEKPTVEFDASGMFFSVGFENESILMYDIRHLKENRYFKKIVLERETGQYASSFKYSRDGTKLLISTTGPKIMLYDANSGLPLANLCGFVNNNINPVEASFTPDSKFVMSGSDDGYIHIWSTDDFLKVAKLPSKHRNPIRFVKFNPKHNMFASSCSVTVFWIPEQKISPKIKN